MTDGSLQGVTQNLEQALAIIRELEQGDSRAAQRTTEAIAALDGVARRLRIWQEEQVVWEGPSPREGGPASPVEGAPEHGDAKPPPPMH